MTRLLILLSLLCAVDARAEDLTFGVHTVSQHWPEKAHHNQVNPGIYVRKDGWQAGLYRNSYSRPTFYAGYVVPLGPIDLMVGAATGYRKECTQTTTHTPEVVTFEKHENGDTATTTTPARIKTTEVCYGFSKHAIAPLAALSYAAPFTILNAQPRLFFMPGFGKVSSVASIAFEWSIK